MLNDFINDFKTSKFYDLLFSGYDVVMIYVAGSQLYGARDDRSDYDLIVLVNGDCMNEPNEYLTYKGKKVHWYWRNVDTFIETGGTYPMRYYGNVLFGYICEDCIIYKNEKYTDRINQLLERKHEIGLNGAKLFYESQKQLVESICKKSRIDESDYTKFLGHLCVTSYYVLNEPIDKELVLKAKRIRWQPVDEDTKWKIIERLRLLKDFMETKTPQTQVL